MPPLPGSHAFRLQNALHPSLHLLLVLPYRWVVCVFEVLMNQYLFGREIIQLCTSCPGVMIFISTYPHKELTHETSECKLCNQEDWLRIYAYRR